MMFHSNQNITVMSTVSKLKVTLILVCAFFFVGLTDAWAQVVISVNGSTTGELCFNNQTLANVPISVSGLTQGKEYYLKKSSENTSTRTIKNVNANGVGTYTISSLKKDISLQ